MSDEKQEDGGNSIMNVHTLIVGAGPTGIGAAIRLIDRGMHDFAIFDKNNQIGGLASTVTTPEGFLFDRGGHVIFSHYNYFDQVINDAVESGWNSHQRVSYVRYKGNWVPYPFQLNLHRLPLDDMISCVNGLIDAAMSAFANPMVKPGNFDEWIMRVQGEGLANTFMRPYNFKVWAIEPRHMQCGWLGERVASTGPDEVKKVVEDVLREKDVTSWGPNAVFRFPVHGGTGQIWQSVAKRNLNNDKIFLSETLTAVDVDAHQARFESGRVVCYRHLISTIPLDQLMALTSSSSSSSASSSVGLFHASSHIIGIGFRGISPHDVKCWLYFPDPAVIFYRATIFSFYSNFNVPNETTLLPTIRQVDGSLASDSSSSLPGPYWSIMFEVSESIHKPVNADTIIEDVLRGAVASGLCLASDHVVSIHHERIEYGYPVPTLTRDAVLDATLNKLADNHQIYSRGRFGAWKYEVANQDHSFMMGVECVDRILSQSLEVTLNYPNTVNSSTYKKLDKKEFIRISAV